MGKVVRVGIADAKICQKPDTITTIGLGSCVGVCLYNNTSDICGLVHIMLPSSQEIKNNSNRNKFADTGVADMIKTLNGKGLPTATLKAKIAGGANMFQFSTNQDSGTIGERNVAAVKDILKEHRIRIEAEDTGLDYGRTIVFDPESRSLTVKSAGMPEKVI